MYLGETPHVPMQSLSMNHGFKLLEWYILHSPELIGRVCGS